MRGRWVVLLRGVNVGGRNMVAMARLRDLLIKAGFAEVTTYLQSGNVVLRSDSPGSEVGAATSQVIKQGFGLDIDVIVRESRQMQSIVERNPLKELAIDPKRHLVTFLGRAPEPAALEKVLALADASEAVSVQGSEIYSYHPGAFSPLWSALAGRTLKVPTTTRNWATVSALAEMARTQE